MLPEEPEGHLDEAIGNRAELEASAKNVVAHAFLCFLDLSNYRIWATNVGEIMLEPEVNSGSHARKHLSPDLLLWIIRFIFAG